MEMSIFSAKAQKEHHEKKEKAKLSRTQIDFTSGSAAKRPISGAAAGTGRFYYSIATYIYIWDVQLTSFAY